MGIMAGRTLPTFKGVMHSFTLEGIHGFGVAAGTEITTFFVDEPLELGGMRLMASQTAPFGAHGRMFECHQQIFFLVTFRTELIALLDEQFGSLGCVWIVAAQAFTLFKGGVLNISSGALKRLHFVALQAKRRAFLVDSERLL